MEIIRYLLWCVYGTLNNDAYELTREHKFIGWCTMIVVLIIAAIIYRSLEFSGWSETKKDFFSVVLTLLIVVIICVLLVIFEPYIAPYIII